MYLRVSVISQAQAAGPNISHCWSSQNSHNLGSAASVIRYRQHMSHSGGQLPQVSCNSTRTSSAWLHGVQMHVKEPEYRYVIVQEGGTHLQRC